MHRPSSKVIFKTSMKKRLYVKVEYQSERTFMEIYAIFTSQVGFQFHQNYSASMNSNYIVKNYLSFLAKGLINDRVI